MQRTGATISLASLNSPYTAVTLFTARSSIRRASIYRGTFSFPAVRCSTVYFGPHVLATQVRHGRVKNGEASEITNGIERREQPHNLKVGGSNPPPQPNNTVKSKAWRRRHFRLRSQPKFRKHSGSKRVRNRKQISELALTLRGLVTYNVLFFIHLETNRVTVAGIAVHPDERWMQQIARNVTMEGRGALRDCRQGDPPRRALAGASAERICWTFSGREYPPRWTCAMPRTPG